MAQQSLVSALHNQCSFALRENSELKSWLAEYHAKYSDSTKIEEQYAQRLCESEHEHQIESRIASSARESSEQWASRFGQMKQELESQTSERTNDVPVEFQEALSAMEIIAAQRDEAMTEKLGLEAKVTELKDRLSRMSSLNEQLQFQLDDRGYERESNDGRVAPTTVASSTLGASNKDVYKKGLVLMKKLTTWSPKDSSPKLPQRSKDHDNGDDEEEQR